MRQATGLKARRNQHRIGTGNHLMCKSLVIAQANRHATRIGNSRSIKSSFQRSIPISLYSQLCTPRQQGRQSGQHQIETFL